MIVGELQYAKIVRLDVHSLLVILAVIGAAYWAFSRMH
jgi:hypothetical protein